MTPAEQTAPTIPAPPPVKACSCGRSFARDEWERLAPPPGGEFMNLGDGEVLSLKNCPAPCSSTLSILVDRPASDDRDDFADECMREDRRERELELDQAAE